MQYDVWWSPDQSKQGLNPTSHCNTSNQEIKLTNDLSPDWVPQIKHKTSQKRHVHLKTG